PIQPLLDRIHQKQLEGYLIIPRGVLTGAKAIYRGDNATNMSLQIDLTATISAAAMTLRARDAGLSEQQVVALIKPVELDAKHTTGTGEAASALASVMLGYVVMLVLYMSILLYGANVLRSVVSEKSNRVVELIVSTTR